MGAKEFNSYNGIIVKVSNHFNALENTLKSVYMN